jgi:hypothetical protein
VTIGTPAVGDCNRRRRQIDEYGLIVVLDFVGVDHLDKPRHLSRVRAVVVQHELHRRPRQRCDH